MSLIKSYPMAAFPGPGCEIAYLDAGHGPPVVLVHGFGSNAHVNWAYTGWVEALVKAGRRVVALDHRGHGRSGKLYEPSDYHTLKMMADVRALIEHLALGRVDMMGYSMGARVTSFFAFHHPEQVQHIALGGLGIHLVDGVGLPDSIALALEAPSLDDVSDKLGRMFRAFAEQTKSDRRALAACIRGSRNVMKREDAAMIRTPALICVGTKDPIAGSAEELAALMPQARAVALEGRDHMSAVGDRHYKNSVISFFSEGH